MSCATITTTFDLGPALNPRSSTNSLRLPIPFSSCRFGNSPTSFSVRSLRSNSGNHLSFSPRDSLFLNGSRPSSSSLLNCHALKSDSLVSLGAQTDTASGININFSFFVFQFGSFAFAKSVLIFYLCDFYYLCCRYVFSVLLIFSLLNSLSIC